MARTVVITRQGIPGISGAGGYTPGGTDVAVADGGTGASSAAAARTNLGLGNVDNTSDANKPVSTAQAAADALAIPKTLFDADTILKADSDDTPAALSVPASRVVARLASGGIVAATVSEIKTLLGIEDSGWVLPTLATDVAVGSFYQHFGYRRIGQQVHLVLRLSITNPANGKTLFTLPAGFRPTGGATEVGPRVAGYSITIGTDGIAQTPVSSAGLIINGSFWIS